MGEGLGFEIWANGYIKNEKHTKQHNPVWHSKQPVIWLVLLFACFQNCDDLSFREGKKKTKNRINIFKSVFHERERWATIWSVGVGSSVLLFAFVQCIQPFMYSLFLFLLHTLPVESIPSHPPHVLYQSSLSLPHSCNIIFTPKEPFSTKLIHAWPNLSPLDSWYIPDLTCTHQTANTCWI